MTLTFEPLISPAIWVTLALVSVCAWGWYAQRRPAGCSRRVWMGILAVSLTGLGMVLLLLLNPLWLNALPPPAGKPQLTVLVDASCSMGTADAPGKSIRFEAARQALLKALPHFERDFDVRLRTFAESSRPVDVDQLRECIPDGLTSDLAEPILQGLLSDQPAGQALLLLSDGVHNGLGDPHRVLEAASLAKAWEAPVYTLTLGGPTEVRDLEVRLPRSQEIAFAGQSIPISVEIRQHGAVSDRAELILESDDQEQRRQQVRLTPGRATQASFLITPPRVGLFQYRVSIPAVSGESTAANNQATLQVRVVDQPIRALVLEGKPYWDSKFLLRMLTDDPSLDVDGIVRVTSDRFLRRRLQLQRGPSARTEAQGDGPDAEATGARRFERRETVEIREQSPSQFEDPQRLRDYQILVLGREAEVFLTPTTIEVLRSWIAQDGGCLICYRGAPVAEPNQQLSRLLPVRWGSGLGSSQSETRFRIQVTERGHDLSWLRLGGGDSLGKLPSLATSTRTDSVKPLAVVLGRGDFSDGSTPVLTYQPYGAGKVVVVEGAGMWRWAFLSPDYKQHDSVYGTLWQSLLRWVVSSGGLLPGEQVSLQMDRVSITEGEGASAVLLRRPEVDRAPLETIELRGEDGMLVQTAQPVPAGEEPGVYQVFFGALPIGHYEARMAESSDLPPGTRSVEFDVLPDLREQLEVAARPDIMSRIAELSGGEVLQADELTSLAETFNDHFRRSRPTQYLRTPAWDRWWVLTGILVLWGLGWTLRRRSGLV